MPIINLVYEAPSGWWGWQPWANTLFYLPLTSNANDTSWNGRNNCVPAYKKPYRGRN